MTTGRPSKRPAVSAVTSWSPKSTARSSGVCQVIIFQHFQHAGGWCCEIESVHVRSDLRSRGIGARAAARGRRTSPGTAAVTGSSSPAATFARTRIASTVANGYGQTSQGFKKFFD